MTASDVFWTPTLLLSFATDVKEEFVVNKFGKFGVIGIVGFAADAIAFTLLYTAIEQLIIARVLAFWLAATVTWFGNRHVTFAGHKSRSVFLQWLKHMGVAHISGAINISSFMYLTHYFSPPVSFCLGIGFATLINYMLLSRFVFSDSEISR